MSEVKARIGCSVSVTTVEPEKSCAEKDRRIPTNLLLSRWLHSMGSLSPLPLFSEAPMLSLSLCRSRVVALRSVPLTLMVLTAGKGAMAAVTEKF